MRRRCYVLMRRRHDIPTRCRGDVPLRGFVDVPSRRRWVFHLRRTCDVAETYRETSLRRRYDVLLPGGSFQHDMTYGKSKYLAKRTESDKVLRVKASKITSNPKYDAYQRGLASMVYKFFDKKSNRSGVATEPNYQLANKLQKQIFGIFKRTEESSIYFVQLTCLINMHGLFL